MFGDLAKTVGSVVPLILGPIIINDPLDPWDLGF